MQESALESQRGPTKPEQGVRVVSRKLLNNALNNIVLTPSYARDLENLPTEV